MLNWQMGVRLERDVERAEVYQHSRARAGKAGVTSEPYSAGN